MQLFSRSISSMADRLLLIRYSLRRRQLSDILQVLRVSLRRALFLPSMSRMRESSSQSTSFLDSTRCSSDRLLSMPSQMNLRSFSQGQMLIRLSLFSPQFFPKQYFMLKNLSPSPNGLSSRINVYNVRFPLISWQKYSKPCEVMPLAAMFKEVRFIDIEFLLQNTPSISLRLFIPASPRLFLDRSSLINATLLNPCNTTPACLPPMSFLHRLTLSRLTLVTPSNATRAPSLPSCR